MTTTVAPSLAPKPSLEGNVARHKEAHSAIFFDSYSDFADSNEQITKQIPAQSYVASTNCTSDFCCNQQYSVTAITTAAGAIAERYAYTAYGLPTILNASATIIATSAISNRYTYTGREWDATLGLHHFRARWMSPIAGRFLGRDPIGYEGSEWGLYEILEGAALSAIDPSGNITLICACHCWGGGSCVGREPLYPRYNINFELEITSTPPNLGATDCLSSCHSEREKRGYNYGTCTADWWNKGTKQPQYPWWGDCSVKDCVMGCALAAASARALCFLRKGSPEVCWTVQRDVFVLCITNCKAACKMLHSEILPDWIE
jgi:RHS repeat-associated protein